MSPLASGYVKEGRRIGSFSPKVILLWHNILFRQKIFFAQMFCYVNQVQVMTCQSDSFFHQITKPRKNNMYVHSGKKCLPRVVCLWSKMHMRTRMREGRGPLPLAFQYLILMIWRPCDLNHGIFTGFNILKVGMSVFSAVLWNEIEDL